MRNLLIWEGLRVDLLLFLTERSQLRWFEHLIRMPFGRFPGEMFQTCPGGSLRVFLEPLERPSLDWLENNFVSSQKTWRRWLGR